MDESPHPSSGSLQHGTGIFKLFTGKGPPFWSTWISSSRVEEAAAAKPKGTTTPTAMATAAAIMAVAIHPAVT